MTRIQNFLKVSRIFNIQETARKFLEYGKQILKCLISFSHKRLEYLIRFQKYLESSKNVPENKK